VVELLKEREMDDVLVIAGGIIPEEDVPFLKQKGVNEVFRQGTFVKDIADYIRKNARHRTEGK
jgi:methylmalonyl-CoA mutase C-terminal domain/subunit